MHIHDAATAYEYIYTWTTYEGTSPNLNASRFLEAARSQRKSAGLCRDRAIQENHLTAARILEGEVARIEQGWLDFDLELD